jgi:hypothetical protein
MKPKNKFHQQILDAGKRLPSISQAQVKWAYQRFEHIGRRTKNGVICCLECGHSWIDKTAEKHCICEHCGTKLTIDCTRKRIFDQCAYFCIITACEGFQVVRFIYACSDARVGKKARYFHSEVIQKWIAPDGKYATLAKLRFMSYYSDTWNFNSNIEVRPEKSLYNIMPNYIYPLQQVIPELKLRGYKQPFPDITPFDLFYALLSYNKAETLLKAGQMKLLRFFSVNGFRYIDKYWASIRICLRNAYKIEDASLWCDYVKLLYFFGKDLHNAKYVCPADLTAEHDKYMNKKREQQEQERRKAAIQKALEDETFFKESKSDFFGIQFTDGLIQVRVLESVEEIKREGDAMHHCVFTNEYHLNADSLILSACINGKRIETVELSLTTLKVVQSRGVCNKNTEYHDRIINLVNKNVSLIGKRKPA